MVLGAYYVRNLQKYLWAQHKGSKKTKKKRMYMYTQKPATQYLAHFLFLLTTPPQDLAFLGSSGILICIFFGLRFRILFFFGCHQKTTKKTLLLGLVKERKIFVVVVILNHLKCLSISRSKVSQLHTFVF